MMSDDATWPGVGRGLLVLAALWWAWAAYVWLTNTLEPEEGRVRLADVHRDCRDARRRARGSEAFATDGILFGFAYLAVRLLHLVLYTIAGKSDAKLLGAVLRIGVVVDG